jgi:hypothetical protein
VILASFEGKISAHMFVIEDCIIQILRIILGKKIKFPGVSSKRIKGGL